MNVLEATLRRISSDLQRYRRQWALIGGFAVSARAEPRFTRDIDVAVMVDDDDGEGLVRSLLDDRYRLLASIEQDQTGRLATVRLQCPVGDSDIVVDLLFASSGIEPEITSAAELTEVVPGLRLPIATTGHLIALKLLARDDQTRPARARHDRGLVFTSQTGEPLDDANVRRAFRSITRRAGLGTNWTPRELRHSYRS